MASPKAHFLHIGKTGGTTVKGALKPHRHDGKYKLILHPHSTNLNDITVREKVFFFLRDPITRFVSGFNSRMRKGRPLYNYQWKAPEAQAFAHFETANELAEALSDHDANRRQEARQAMEGIQHVGDSVWKWFQDPHYFSSRIDDVLFVGFQESLESDFRRLLIVLELDGNIVLPTDPVAAHKTPAGFDQSISELGARNLRTHYATDIEFYKEMKGIHGVT